MATYNVLTEPWIPTVDKQGGLRELGIADVLASAHELEAIVDSSPLIQFGLYRLLIAFVMDAYSINETEDLEDLLKKGRFEQRALDAYFLEKCADAFDLFSPKRPFLQAGAADELKRDSVSRLFQHLPAGGGLTHFHHLDQRTQAFSPAVCARGLCTIAPFMTAGGAGYSPSINGIPPWYVLVLGENLFETIALNCATLSMTWLNGNESPAWRSRTEVLPKMPVSKVSLLQGLTWRPRRVRLFPGEGGVCKYSGVNSDILIREIGYGPGAAARLENNWRDPQAALRISGKGLSPLRPLAGRELWRDTGPLLLLHEKDYESQYGKVRFERPLVVEQFDYLRKGRFLSGKRTLHIEAYGMQTDGKMKIYEWRYERLVLPAVVSDIPGAGGIIQEAVEKAESVATKIAGALKLAYPREGSGNKNAFKEMIDAVQKQYWELLRQDFELLLKTLSEANPEDINIRSGNMPNWIKKVVRQASACLDAAIEHLDADADGLFRQVRARDWFRMQTSKLFIDKARQKVKVAGEKEGGR